MTNFSIKDVEALTGIKSHTLRIWEHRYGIPLPNRTATNIRYYTDEDLKLLLNVAMLNRKGYKISKITKMSKEEVDTLVLDLTLQSNDETMHLESLIKAMFGLDEESFIQIFQASIDQIGFEESFKKLIFPLMARIGIMWQTGSINPAYEHFVTHLIRLKLFSALNALPKIEHQKAKKFVLFLPAHEPHDVTLLFANYLIRLAGHHTNYLGPNLPLNDLHSVMKLYKADYILTVLTSSISNQTPLQIANKLHADFPSTNILIAGSQIFQSHIQYPPQVTLLYDFDDFNKLLKAQG
ncbi:MAG: MerR family transcriptional regulator [Bacteroidia bacterium]|jgi:DNA-binding transcriptional MerR regulator|nr:MerR family transcriptional regulator [Bacteroidota bacterium]MBP6512859.1 MerR family transcriptional regulator [Bacteroidia bacterium]MBP7245490.1 MerR family transcriptional regulator [Bacteroidia bacterium]